jgi:solute:Na+ symporter, SSS family
VSAIDSVIIAVYFASMIGLGFWYQRRASKNIESYFLGGNRIHWLALAVTGSVSTFDITGTMWMVTLVYLFGMKSIWNHWMWGFMMAAFFMAFMGKWVRRSRVMTGAEWMITRFGDRTDGRTARLSYALMAVITLVGLIGYAFQGIGKFAAEYVHLGLNPEFSIKICAIVIFAITTLYVLLGGLYSVVITHIIQTAILTIASIVVAAIAYCHLTPSDLAAVAPVDGTGFTSLMPIWKLENAAALPTAYQGYEMFGALVVVWVVKGLLLNFGGPGQMFDFQMFLSTRDPRDAAKVGAAWSGFLIVRWAMVMGIALLAICGHVDIIGQNGQIDPEIVMPKVLGKHLGPGVLGLVLAGLLAAFMATFAATVNAGASYIVRDLWQPLVRPRASDKELMRASYIATVGIVVVGTMIGLYANSIRQVWDWIMLALGAAFVIPNVLRWYWWRFNGTGYAAGTLAGLAGAMPLLALSLSGIEPPIYITFPALCGISFVASIIGTYLTRPTDEAVLIEFYRTVRPFGWWRPIREISCLTSEELHDPAESAWLAMVNLLLAAIAIFGVYVAPMYLVGHWHGYALTWFLVALVAAVTLKFTWYDHLPKAELPEEAGNTRTMGH